MIRLLEVGAPNMPGFLQTIRTLRRATRASRVPGQRSDADREVIEVELARLSEREALEKELFFATPVAVPAPPMRLVAVFVRATLAAFSFDPFYFPPTTFTPDASYPGWKVRPEDFFWKAAAEGKIRGDSATTSGFWALVDTTSKPSGGWYYPNDPFGPMLSVFRSQGLLRRTENIPDISRLGLSHYEVQRLVAVELARMLRINDDDGLEIRSPSAIEYNFMGNVRYGFLGEGPGGEWLHDGYGEHEHLTTGANLGQVNFWLSGNRHGTLGFRLMIVFREAPRLSS